MDARAAVIRTALTLAAPLKALKVRSIWLEERLGLPLTDADHVAIAKALDRDKLQLGSYYHWYLEKALVARGLRHAKRDRVLATVKDADRTDYTPIDKLLSTPGGLVLAIPHFGNYILAIMGLFAHYGHQRDIGIFWVSGFQCGIGVVRVAPAPFPKPDSTVGSSVDLLN